MKLIVPGDKGCEEGSWVIDVPAKCADPPPSANLEKDLKGPGETKNWKINK